jgi:opacity protein-like surface antigen
MSSTFRSALPALALACASALTARTAHAQYRVPPAQSSTQPTWYVDGTLGVAAPIGTFGSGLDAGFDVMGGAEFWTPATAPIGWRAELGYTRFGASYVNGSAGIFRFAVDAIYDVKVPTTRISPYVLAGIGLYDVSGTVDYGCAAGFLGTCSVSNSTGAFGFNLGGGVRIPIAPALEGTFEVRYHLPLGGLGGLRDSPFFPFQFGVRYRIP